MKITAPFFGALAVLAVLTGLSPDCGFSQTPFYQGKTLTVLASTAPGGTADMRIKVMVPFLRKHIPGNPNILVEYMPGGGGRKAANHLFRAANPDGLTIGVAGGAIIGLNVMRESGVMYDIDKFLYLGAPESITQFVFYTRKELGLSDLNKLRESPGIRVGAQSIGHVSYVAGRLFAYMLGLNGPKFIAGYAGGPEVAIALIQGELDATATIASSVLRRNPEFIEKNLMDFHAILEIPKGERYPRFGHLPEIESFAKTEKETKLLSMWRTLRLAGSPYVLPPGTPEDRVEILQQAVRKVFRDSDFHKEFKKLVGDDPTPVMPEELAKAIREIPREIEVIELLRNISGTEPLSRR